MSEKHHKNESVKRRPHYFNVDYNTKGRFCSYWHQINEVISLQPENILEIGVGNRFVSNYLKIRDFNLITLDINEGLKPDVTGSVLRIPFIDKFFDIVACYEVLEHLPYGEFSKALKEIYRVSRKHAVLSLPDVTTVYRVNIELSRIKPIKILIPFPFTRPKHHEFGGEHYFEIGKIGYPLKKIESDIEKSGFKIVTTYRVFEFIYHRFFILEKI